jgi:hypothetical protein
MYFVVYMTQTVTHLTSHIHVYTLHVKRESASYIRTLQEIHCYAADRAGAG